MRSHQTTAGVSGEFVLTGEFSNAEPTTAPVEFRLYGWSAASIRARFASVVDSAIALRERARCAGRFFYIAGGQLDIDFGGAGAGVGYDGIHVTGSVNLQGDLNVSLLDEASRYSFRCSAIRLRF